MPRRLEPAAAGGPIKSACPQCSCGLVGLLLGLAVQRRVAGLGAADSWQQPALWRSCWVACTTPPLPLLEDKGILAPVLMFTLLLSAKHPLATWRANLWLKCQKRKKKNMQCTNFCFLVWLKPTKNCSSLNARHILRKGIPSRKFSIWENLIVSRLGKQDSPTGLGEISRQTPRIILLLGAPSFEKVAIHCFRYNVRFNRIWRSSLDLIARTLRQMNFE